MSVREPADAYRRGLVSGQASVHDERAPGHQPDEVPGDRPKP